MNERPFPSQAGELPAALYGARPTSGVKPFAERLNTPPSHALPSICQQFPHFLLVIVDQPLI